MKKIVLNACLLALVGFGSACGGSDTNSSTDSTAVSVTDTVKKDTSVPDTNQAMAPAASDTANPDKTFVTEAANGGMTEIEMGKLAQTNASSSKVKEFAKMMIEDHTKAGNELKVLAAKKNIEVPAALNSESIAHLNDMKAMKGTDFDKAYVNMMVDDHKKTVSKFEDEMTNTKDADFKTWTSKTLPVLRKHSEKIITIQAGMK